MSLCSRPGDHPSLLNGVCKRTDRQNCAQLTSSVPPVHCPNPHHRHPQPHPCSAPQKTGSVSVGTKSLSGLSGDQGKSVKVKGRQEALRSALSLGQGLIFGQSAEDFSIVFVVLSEDKASNTPDIQLRNKTFIFINPHFSSVTNSQHN